MAGEVTEAVRAGVAAEAGEAGEESFSSRRS